jgi:hypothetical protein
VSEGVPADVLRDPNLGCSWTDYLSHEALAPIWSLPTRCSAREYPIVGLAVFCVVTPHLERTNNLENDGPRDAEFMVLEVEGTTPFLNARAFVGTDRTGQ